jgi:DNA-directed RNA polymerase specialized sigma24 family protein
VSFIDLFYVTRELRNLSRPPPAIKFFSFRYWRLSEATGANMTKVEDTLHDTGRTIGTDGLHHEDKPTDQRSAASTEKEMYLRFARVILPHLGDALSLAQCLTGTCEAAHELLQEVFTRTLFDIGRAANDDTRAWVLTQVFCAWVSRYETFPSLDTKLLSELEQAVNELGPVDENTASGLGRKSDNEPLEQSIAALPAVFRETFLLRELGLSYKKISEIIGVPVGTVMSRLARARRLCDESTADVQT